MPFERALSTGVLKAVGSIRVVAMPLTPAAMAAFMAVTMSVDERSSSTRSTRARYAEDRGRVLEPVDRGREERVGRHMVDERELVRRVAGEQRVVLVSESLSRGASFAEDIDQAPEERHGGRSDTGITQEPPTGLFVLFRVCFNWSLGHLQITFH